LDHLHAQKTNAAERYLLGELPAGEAEEFELHYFECQQCALAVETGESFVAHARAYFRDAEIPQSISKKAQEPGQPGRSFLQAIAAFFRPAFAIPVMAALAAVAVYQGTVVIPGMQRVLNTASLLPAVQLIGASRGDETVLHVRAGSHFAAVAADIPSGSEFKFPQYVCVLNRGGQEVFNLNSPAPAEGEPITLQIPVSQLKSGSQALVLFGVGPNGQRSDKISTYPFSVQFN
jgi:hypothetical protein